ncbi:type II secretion system protein [Amycolatopsis sp. NPDC048633]|uniref:type II secretion system protein n=1 Tax=Amycolatopsis sp. NPDC048633 TaxID=3157095 RepID=UPI003405EAAF
MSTEAALIALAITAAIGVTLIVAAFAPTRPRLADVLNETSQGSRGLRDVAVAHADRLKLIAKPADLALVGQSSESLVAQRVGFLLVGALWIPVLTTVLVFVGAMTPMVLTGGASVGCALVGWQLPVLVLKNKVKHARATFAGALAAYCRLVALGRLGDRGPVEALRYPVTLGTGWAFRRIKLAIDEAVLRGRMPWAGFAELAEETGVRELKDVGHIIASAGQDGASIVDTLRAKASALDEKQLAERKTGSAIRSDRMDMPVALLGLAFIAFLAFPGLYLMLHT